MKVDGVVATLDRIVQERVDESNRKFNTSVYVRDFNNVVQHGHYYTITETGVDGLDGCECYIAMHSAVYTVLVPVDPLPILLERKRIWYR